MKTKLIVLNLLLIVTVLSCKDAKVSFKVPQPESMKVTKEFPSRLIGKYYNYDNNSAVIINKYFILKTMLLTDTLSILKLEQDEIVKKDTLYNLKTGEKYKVKIINDTLFTNYVYSDTIFNIMGSNILKKYNGFYFLNKAVGKSDSWEVQKLSLNKGILTINGIETETEINLLEKLTETIKDTVKPFVLKPSKKQFKNFIKQNGFTLGEIYLKE